MILQPIKTAPKDGRWILLAGDNGKRFEVCRWSNSQWRGTESRAFDFGGEEPTHWAALPFVVDERYSG